MAADLIVFGEDWNGLPSSTQHLIGELSHTRQILWINSIGMRRPRLTLRDGARLLQKAAAMLKPQAQRSLAKNNVRVVHPRVLPMPRTSFSRTLNRALLGASLHKHLADARSERPVLWLSLPTAVDYVGQFGERAVVYYCGDDFGALEGVDHAEVLEKEADLARRADLILVSHPALAHKFPSCKVQLISHGVDVTRFRDARPIAPPSLNPIAGFVGSIDSRLDIPALTNAARALPNWQFHFHGPVKTDVMALRTLPNVMFHGPLAPERVPATIKSWQVALLPYVDNAMVRACNPLKLREYLATGTAVVAIEMPAMAEFRDVATVTDPDHLADAIRHAAAQDTDILRQARMARVVHQSWQAQAARVAAMLDGL